MMVEIIKIKEPQGRIEALIKLKSCLKVIFLFQIHLNLSHLNEQIIKVFKDIQQANVKSFYL